MKRSLKILLRLYPAEFRAEYGPEMDELLTARAKREPACQLVKDLVIDVLRTAAKEHLSMWHKDIKHSLRALRNAPAFTAVAVLSLALGLGANSAIFSLAYALLLRPLPVPDPSGLLILQGTRTAEQDPQHLSHPDFLELRKTTQSFHSLIATQDLMLGFAARPGDTAQMKLGAFVSANFFDEINVPLERGRPFRPDEDEAPGRNPVVVISHELWTDQFQSDPSILSRKIRLNNVELAVIGVAPAHFSGLRNMIRASFFIPIYMSPAITPTRAIPGRRDIFPLDVRGRLRPGVSIDQANAEMATLARNLETAHPESNRGRGLRVRTEFQQRFDASPPDAVLVGMLLVTTLLVLIIACVNVANLLLARGQARTREISVRLALGASRSRILRELLTESLLLAIAGGAIGLLIAAAATSTFNSIEPPSDFPILLNVQIDRQVFLFNALLCLASALLCGLVPALRSLQPDLVSGLKGGDAQPRSLWGRGTLVASQIAVSCVLLIIAAMMIAGMRGTLLKEPGFRIDNVLITGLNPLDPNTANPFYDRLLDRVRATPGVVSATLATAVPTANDAIRMARVVPEGYTLPPNQQDLQVFETDVTEDYFASTGIPILSGRPITRQDDNTAPRVAVVNELFAQRYYPGQDAVGKRFRMEGQMVQIVGIARRTKYIFISEGPTDAIYLSARQSPRMGRMTLMVHTASDAASFSAPVREIVRQIDASVPLTTLRTMADYHDRRTVGVMRLLVRTVTALGAVGLLLALIGLYGTMSYAVSRRTREIGIRMAIGAAPASIRQLLLKQGAWIAGPGIAVGLLVGYFAASIFEQGFLGMAVAHPAVFFVVPSVLATAALAACWLPARRAAATPPTQALRCD